MFVFGRRLAVAVTHPGIDTIAGCLFRAGVR